MAPIQRNDRADPQSLSSRDNRSVDGSEWQVAVPMDQFGNPDPILVCDLDRDEVPLGEITQEPNLPRRAKPFFREVRHLCNDEDGHRERPGEPLEQG